MYAEEEQKLWWGCHWKGHLNVHISYKILNNFLSQEASELVDAEVTCSGGSLYICIFFFWVTCMFGECNTNWVTIANRFRSAGQNSSFEEKIFKLLSFLFPVLFCLRIVDVVSVGGFQTFYIPWHWARICNMCIFMYKLCVYNTVLVYGIKHSKK